MMGASGVLDPARMQDNLGIIPRLCRDLFRRIAEEEEAEAAKGGAGAGEQGVTTRFSVKASYLEIYCERVRDLFALEAAAMGTAGALAGGAPPGVAGAAASSSTTAHNLRVREHPTRGAYVEGLTEVCVKSYEEVEKLLVAGSYMRTVAETRMNPTSSRSHAVFTLHFTQTRVAASSAGGGQEQVLGVRTSKIVLVDLAGSERADTLLTGGGAGVGSGVVGAVGAGGSSVAAGGGASGPSSTQEAALRMREMTKINTSLSALGAVIKALSTSSGAAGGGAGGAGGAGGSKASSSKDDAATSPSGSFVPYRNSVLTWLLRDSLGGNSKTTMVATVAPGDGAYSETLSTLKYCESVKKIVTTTVINDTAFNSPSGLGKGALPANAAVPITDARADAMLADLRREVAQLRRQLAEYERQKTETERLALQRSKIESALSHADAQRGHFPLIGVVTAGGAAAAAHALPPGTPAAAGKTVKGTTGLPFSPAPRAPPIPGLALETPAHVGGGGVSPGGGAGAAASGTRPAWTSPASKRGSPPSSNTATIAIASDGVVTLAPPAPVTVSLDLASVLSLPQTPGSSMAMSGAFTTSGLAASLAAPKAPTPDRIFGIAAAALAKSGIHVLLSPPPRTGGAPRVDRSALRPAPVIDLGASLGPSNNQNNETGLFTTLSTTGGSESTLRQTSNDFGALLSSPVIAGEGGGPRGAGLDRLDLQSPSSAGGQDGGFGFGGGAGGGGGDGASIYDLDDASVRSLEDEGGQLQQQQQQAPAPAWPAPPAAAFVDLGASTGSFYSSAASASRPTSVGSTLRLTSAARMAQEGAMADPFTAATALGMSSSGAALYASAAAAGGRLAGAAERAKAGVSAASAAAVEASRGVINLSSPAPIVRPLPAPSPSTGSATRSGGGATSLAASASLSAHLAAAAADAEQAAARAREEERASCAQLIERERAAAAAEADVLRAGLTDLEARAAAAEMALAAATERACAAEGSVLSLTTRLRFVQEEHKAAVAAAGERIEALTAEVTRLNEALAASEAGRTAALTEAARAATDATGQAARVKHLESELTAVVTRSHEASAAAATADSRARTAEARASELERLVGELKASLARRGEELQEASKAAAAAGATESGLQARLRKLEAENAEQAAALVEAKAATAAAAASAATEAARATKAEAEARVASGRAAEAEAHAALLASKASELRGELDGTRARADQLELQLTARAITADEAAASLARERTSLSSMRSRLSELEHELQRANNTAASAEARVTSLTADADRLRTAVSALQADLERRDARVVEVTSELNREMARAAAKERELAAQIKALRDANDADAAATAREVGRFTAEFSGLRSQVAELHEAMAAAEVDREKALVEAAGLRRELSQVRDSWLATLRERDTACRDRDMLRLQVKVMEARVGRVCEEAGVAVPTRDTTLRVSFSGGGGSRAASPSAGTSAWLESEDRRRLLERLKSADHRAETLQSHVEALMSVTGTH